MFITREKIENSVRFQVITCLILSFVLNLIIEICGRRGVKAGFEYLIQQPVIFFYNMLLILLTLSFVILIRRRVFGWCLVSIIWLALGITNGIMLGFRVTPFTAIDLLEAKAGLSIMNQYFTKTQFVLLIVGIAVAIGIFILAFILAPKYKGKLVYKRNVLFVFTFVVAFYLVTKFSLSAGILTRHFGNLNFAYKDYGVPYCFTVTMLDTGIKQPLGYSKTNVLKAANTEFSDADSPIAIKEGTEESTPNIVFVQLESFFDPTKVKGLTFSEDPIPTYRKLLEEYSSGYLKVPVVGAGTCNTEFEVITGMNLNYFGPGEYPYKTVLRKKTSESVAYDLKELGYSTHAIHNNSGTFYDRNKVFPNLGFDTFTSIEYMDGVEKNPNDWAKDKVLTSQILDAINSSDDPDYIYTISVQGHGNYPTSPIDDTQTITVEGTESEEKKNAYEYYATQIHEMDNFVKELTEALSQLDEDVILVLYGDHLPSLGIDKEDLENNSIFQTEYIIWDNFGLEKEDMNLEAYQLSAAVLSRVGISNGTMIQYHQRNMGSKNYYKYHKMLMYDMLYGNQYIYGGETPFKPIDLTMGVKEIRITEITENTDNILVMGDNFTPYSKVFVGDNQVETTFVNNTTLQIEKGKIKPEDVVTVKQSGKDRTILSTSEEYIYN